MAFRAARKVHRTRVRRVDAARRLFLDETQADDLDWVALLASCAAFESYCRVFTADLQPDRIAKFLLVHPEFPYSVRYSVERMHESLTAIIAQSSGRQRARIERIIGRLHASLAYTPVSELLSGDLHAFLNGVLEQCRALHAGRARNLYRLSRSRSRSKLMFYAIRHFTRYRYSRPVWQSMMEVRMHPRSENSAAVLHVPALGQPAGAHLLVHGPPRQPGPSLRSAASPSGAHDRGRLAGEHRRAVPLPDSLPVRSVGRARRMIDEDDHWQMLMPSHYARSSPQLEDLARELGVHEADGRDPLTLVRDINDGIHDTFEYVRKSTA